ncbi:MAG: transglutaminaseTgpA domain-containing protein [Thermomicrobiales bacterium]
MTFLLLAGTILIVSGAIQQADWADDLAVLTPVTIGALLLGLGLAKWRRLPWFLAHPLAALIGGWFIVNRLEPVLPLAADQHNWTTAFNFLIERARVWYSSTGTDQYADDFYLFLFGVAALMFLVAYASTWMVFRSRWIWPALLLPAVVLLVNLGYAPSSVSTALVFFVAGAVLLIARFHMAEREEEWQRGGVAYPESLGWRAISIGVVVVLLTVSFGWGAPFAVSGKLLDTAWGRVNGPWLKMEGFFNDRFGSLRGPGARGAGNFAAFGDRFRLGGPLKLSQNPVLVLQADRPYYLKARTYDTFDGHQWNSNVDSTFVSNNDGRNYVPQIELAKDQDLTVPPLTAAERRDLTIRMLRPGAGPLMIADQFVNANQDSLVVLSWKQYRNESIALDGLDIESLPPDLRQIATLLTTATGPLRNTDDQGNLLPVRVTPTATPTTGPRTPTATVGTTTPVPTATPYYPTPATWEKPIEDERAALRNRLISVRPVVRNGVAVRMIVDGQLPNYGDVEAVLPKGSVDRGSTYHLTALSSTALAPELRDAGGNYPDWVVKRYLQLPGSTTDRTRQLAKELENGLVPYDAAMSIQNWLRENIKYNEAIPYPPDDRDVVDYLLFDSRQGYCEYYSTAMVVMLRSLGIPAREVVGYFSGEYDNDQIGYLYRESNAHAWVEVYFPNYGWIAFEPTSPRPAFEREPAPPPSGDPNAGATVGGGATGTGGPDDLLPEDPPLFPGGAGGSGTLAQQPNRVVEVARIAFPIAALLIAILAFLWLSGFRGLSPSGQFYARMTRSGRLAGVRPPPGTTPYEWARAVGDRVPKARRSLDQITDLYVREQYAREEPSIQDLRLVRRAWLSFRGALLRSFFSFRRHQPAEEGGD